MHKRSAKGQSSADAILRAAEKLLIEEGYSSFSLRKVAQRADQSLGSLQYYFPNKDNLVQAMLDNCIARYLTYFDQLREAAGEDPEAQFKALISGIVKDLNTAHTTGFFPEVWSLANHNPRATEFMDAMYGRYRNVLSEVIGQLNADLDPEQRARLALFISASLEGHTMFIGHNKPWQSETSNIISMSTQSFLWLIRSGQVP